MSREAFCKSCWTLQWMSLKSLGKTREVTTIFSGKKFFSLPHPQPSTTFLNWLNMWTILPLMIQILFSLQREVATSDGPSHCALSHQKDFEPLSQSPYICTRHLFLYTYLFKTKKFWNVIHIYEKGINLRSKAQNFSTKLRAVQPAP